MLSLPCRQAGRGTAGKPEVWSLVHGQSTNARSELQLLIAFILSPGWRKDHVGGSVLLIGIILSFDFQHLCIVNDLTIHHR